MSSRVRYLERIDLGFGQQYPRSRMEMGLLVSAGLLIAVVVDSPLVRAVGIVWAIGIVVLYLWRLGVVVRKDSREGDRQYDQYGKFKLSKEYHHTKSATAASERKAKKNG